jgi:hypothetical protein
MEHWNQPRDEAGVRHYRPRDEITIRNFPENEPMRMQIGEVGLQRLEDGELPMTLPDGSSAPRERAGGATQYVVGLEPEVYTSRGPMWTGPAPYETVRPEGLWGGAATGGVIGAGSSAAAGAAAEGQKD